MSDYAIISVNGTQELVRVGDVVRVRGEVSGDSYEFSDVFMLGGSKISFGAPVVKGATVTGKVGGLFKGPKLRIATFKAKSNKHRVRGYRDLYTNVTITAINV